MTEKLQQLRAWMQSQKLDGYIVPRGDEYLNEYVPPHNERLLWLTGFSGSAGFAVVSSDHAALFTDGRYTMQAEKECGAYFAVKSSVDDKLSTYLKNLELQRVGYDPRMHSVKSIQQLEKDVRAFDIELLEIIENPVDLLWQDRPAPHYTAAFVHDLSFAGHTHKHKINLIAEILALQNAGALLVTDPTAIAWLLNIRGRDIPHMPVILSTLILFADRRVEWFVEKDKINQDVRNHLADIVIRHDDFDWHSLENLAILLDPAITPASYAQKLKAVNAVLQFGTDPIQLAKACKNDTEIEGMRSAHARDAIAVKNAIGWIKTNPVTDELGIVQKLHDERLQQNLFLEESFSTIAGFGANGAIIHYHPTENTNKKLQPDNLLLLDSGGHYLDGTTDVTRTIAIGTPSDEHKYHYTLVLKGLIDTITTRFPHGTTGAQLDGLARHALWQAGLDYDHGTGHGVGLCLSVHEGPQNISKRGHESLLPGMVVSIEPGYYKPDHYGIRLENLAVVIADDEKSDGRQFYRFSCLTQVPFDENLILWNMLSDNQSVWLKSYQAQSM